MARFKKLLAATFLLLVPLVLIGQAVAQHASENEGKYTGDVTQYYNWLTFSSQGTTTTLDTLITTTADTSTTTLYVRECDEIGLYVETVNVNNQDSLIVSAIGTVEGTIYDTNTPLDTIATAGLDFNIPVTSSLVSVLKQFDRVKIRILQKNGASTDCMTVRVKAAVTWKGRGK